MKVFGWICAVILGLTAFGYFIDDDGNIDKSKVDNVKSMFRDSPSDDLVSARTPPMWQRIEDERYSYAVPKSWDTQAKKPDYRTETFAMDTIEEHGFFANINTLTLEDEEVTPIELAKQLRSKAKKNGATKVSELSPFTVSNGGDATGNVFPSVYTVNYDGVSIAQYTAVIDTGGGSALLVTIAAQPGSLEDLADQIMGTFIVWG